MATRPVLFEIGEREERKGRWREIERALSNNRSSCWGRFAEADLEAWQSCIVSLCCVVAVVAAAAAAAAAAPMMNAAVCKLFPFDCFR